MSQQVSMGSNGAKIGFPSDQSLQWPVYLTVHSLDKALEFEKVAPLKQNFAKPQVGESKQMPSIWVIQWFGILQNLVESISIIAR